MGNPTDLALFARIILPPEGVAEMLAKLTDDFYATLSTPEGRLALVAGVAKWAAEREGLLPEEQSHYVDRAGQIAVAAYDPSPPFFTIGTGSRGGY